MDRCFIDEGAFQGVLSEGEGFANYFSELETASTAPKPIQTFEVDDSINEAKSKKDGDGNKERSTNNMSGLKDSDDESEEQQDLPQTKKQDFDKKVSGHRTSHFAPLVVPAKASSDVIAGKLLQHPLMRNWTGAYRVKDSASSRRRAIVFDCKQLPEALCKPWMPKNYPIIDQHGKNRLGFFIDVMVAGDFLFFIDSHQDANTLALHEIVKEKQAAGSQVKVRTWVLQYDEKPFRAMCRARGFGQAANVEHMHVLTMIDLYTMKMVNRTIGGGTWYSKGLNDLVMVHPRNVANISAEMKTAIYSSIRQKGIDASTRDPNANLRIGTFKDVLPLSWPCRDPALMAGIFKDFKIAAVVVPYLGDASSVQGSLQCEKPLPVVGLCWNERHVKFVEQAIDRHITFLMASADNFFTDVEEHATIEVLFPTVHMQATADEGGPETGFTDDEQKEGDDDEVEGDDDDE